MSHRNWLTLIAIISCLALTYAGVLLLNASMIIELTREDHVVQWLGALSFLGAAACFFWGAVRCRSGSDRQLTKGRPKSAILLLLGLLFLVAFAEEISWGQRLLGIETPAFLKEINVQNEINIHNLRVFHGTHRDEERAGWSAYIAANRLFNLFWLFYCVLLPMLKRVSRAAAARIEQIGLPLPPFWLGGCFAVNWVLYHAFARAAPPGIQHALVEVKETLFGLLFFLVGLQLLYAHLRRETVLETSHAG